MPRFSARSLQNLDTCHRDLQQVFNEVVLHIDCTILEGHRGEAEQNEAVRKGTSQIKWPDGMHNKSPSRAVDVAPWPIDWENRRRFTLFAGFVLGIAATMDIKLRWGGDWNQNWDPTDQRFHDLPHFELK